MTIYQELKEQYPTIRFNIKRLRVSPFNITDRYIINLSLGDEWLGTFHPKVEAIKNCSRERLLHDIYQRIRLGSKGNYNV